MKSLVEAGADVNDIPDYTFVCHRTALSLAAQMGHTESVSALIAAGADVNQMDARPCTALCYAAQGSQSKEFGFNKSNHSHRVMLSASAAQMQHSC